MIRFSSSYAPSMPFQISSSSCPDSVSLVDNAAPMIGKRFWRRTSAAETFSLYPAAGAGVTAVLETIIRESSIDVGGADCGAFREARAFDAWPVSIVMDGGRPL